MFRSVRFVNVICHSSVSTSHPFSQTYDILHVLATKRMEINVPSLANCNTISLGVFLGWLIPLLFSVALKVLIIIAIFTYSVLFARKIKLESVGFDTKIKSFFYFFYQTFLCFSDNRIIKQNLLNLSLYSISLLKKDNNFRLIQKAVRNI